MKKTKLMLGDNIESLKKLPDNSIDSVVTDPPYGLSAPKNSGKTSKGGFMNKKWDYDVPSIEFWKEVYRVLKPGGHVLSFGGTRTYHRMVVNIEDAGFEIRDQIQWIYGSGFPKSHNIGKAVDKLEGNDREVVGKLENYQDKRGLNGQANVMENAKPRIDIELTKGTSPYEGWGTALKPANEPICVARKPLSEKSVAENVLKWGTGGINVDGCRVETDRNNERQYDKEPASGGICGDTNFGKNLIRSDNWLEEGRFPANIILECICDEVIKGEKGEMYVRPKVSGFRENFIGGGDVLNSGSLMGNYTDKGDIHTDPNCPCFLLDEQSGESKSSNSNRPLPKSGKFNGTEGENYRSYKYTNRGHNDKGGASRFFYQAKVSKAERNMGLDGFEVEILTPTMKLLLKTDYNNKNFIWEKEDLKTTPVDTDKLHQKDTEEYITTDDNKWSTELFGKVITGQFLMDTKSIILTEINSTTIYQTLNSLIQKNIKTNTQELNGLMVKDIKLVSDVENKNIKMSFILQNKDGYSQNVNLVELEEVWKISVKENKCGHPTLKPINLMAYLCRLITPEGGIVLDPFMGSGSTGIAAQLEGFRFVGMEMDEDYFKIASARIDSYEKYKKFKK